MASNRSNLDSRNHNSLLHAEDAFAVETMGSSKDDHAMTDGMDITAGQKMISAITGSLMTSLLGMFTMTQSLCIPLPSIFVLLTAG
jgi:hypothetical protein